MLIIADRSVYLSTANKWFLKKPGKYYLYGRNENTDYLIKVLDFSEMNPSKIRSEHSANLPIT